MGIFLFAKNLEKKEIIQNIVLESDAAKRLVEQINIRYNEATLIQEIGQATSMILDIDELLKYIMDALEKRLDFKRGMVMMADKGKKRLTFSFGYGYSPEENQYLSKVSFSLDNPTSKGVAVITFRDQTPFLIDDVSGIKKNISPKSLEFVQRMGAGSFISVPIVFKGESMGILLVDTPKSGRQLSQSDLNLLMGIAPQIAISINNAISYQKIQESEERFRSLSANSPDIIYTLGNDGAFTYVNPAWERILGHPPEEVIGRYFIDFVHPEDIPFYKTIFKRTRDARDTVRDLTGTILHRNGSERYFSISAAPNLDAEGSFLGVVGTFKDITDRKVAEDALQVRVEFEKLIASISTHFINLAPEELQPEINQALKRIGAFAGVDRSYIFRFQDQSSKADVSYEWCAEGITPLIGQQPGLSIDRLPWFQQTISRQEVFLVPDLSLLPPEAREEKAAFQERGVQSIVCVPMIFGGKLIGFLGFDSIRRRKAWSEEIITLLTIVGEIFTNALDRIRVEEEKAKLEDQLRQSQKMEAIGRLAGGVAHDFNNMLTGIIGYADLLLLSLNRDNPLVGKVEEIKKAGKRAASLTQQLLAFSRKQLLQPKVMDLNTVVNDLKKMLQRLIGEDVSLETVLEPDPWPIKVDPNQMGQVLMNLVVNARDAMPQGGKVTIRTANTSLDQTHGRQWGVKLQPGPYVLLAVQDDGQGMDKETQSHIFEPFFTTKELGKGTGLGLSTVYGIIKQSDGFIWVDSQPSNGTVFKIFLPRAEGYSAPRLLPSETGVLLTGSETVLVVEDNDLVRNLTREALQQYGYRVIEAANGELALKIGREYPDVIHLLLTDVVMPGINGRELAEKMRVLRSEIKVLFMSGYTDNAIVQYGILEPGLSFIEKPFSPDLLAGRIHQVLNSRPNPPA
ncbi:MAG: PAS domain S-box protein [Deltaproteobacteria bacterium]|nr:PAS domain S-box protein [Deltaproteobacteria bacterium]